MAEIVNLRRARKRLAREAEARAAAENRAKFGQTRSEREANAAGRERADRDLDAKKLDDQ